MARNEIHGPGIIVSRVDYKDRRYIGPMIAQKNTGAGRGYVLRATSPVAHYPGGSVFRVCAWPDNPRGSLQGWCTLREAREWAQRVNDGPESGFQCLGWFREHGLYQCRGFDAYGRHFNRAFRTKREARAFLSAMRRGDNRVARY